MQPLVGGEPARLLLDTIRGFPLSVSGGRVNIHQVANPTGMAALDRAYEIVELEVMTDLAHCGAGHEHRTLDEDEFRHLVLSEIVRQAKEVVGESLILDPIWECRL
jgi:hypothetical protein